MSESDQDAQVEALFREEMAGVTPLKSDSRARINRNQDSALQHQARRKAATNDGEVDHHGMSTELRQVLDPYYPLEFRRDGVQHGVFRKFKQGKYDIEARLDLHRMTVEQARREVYDFIVQASEYDLRNLIIIHGKGNHSQSPQALLKSFINQWLPELESVQAYCSAQPRHGGVGAVYVLLKKTDRRRQQNRLHFNRGRVDNT